LDRRGVLLCKTNRNITYRNSVLVTGSGNLQSGHTDTTVTTPYISIDVTNFNRITLTVNTYANWNLCNISADNGISVSVGTGTYTYDISGATKLTLKGICDISTYADCKFIYVLE